MGTVVMVLWSGCMCQVIEDIKGCYPEVKARSKSDKRLRSCGHLKITIKNDLECINLPSKKSKNVLGEDSQTPLDRLTATSPLNLDTFALSA